MKSLEDEEGGIGLSKSKGDNMRDDGDQKF